MSQAQHFSDYGFDPQIDYFQFMEEAKKHKKEKSTEAIQFKLEKPISKDDMLRTKLHRKNRKRWFWKKALLFFKWRKWSPISAAGRCSSHYYDYDGDVHMERARNFRAASGSISGPVYVVTESWSGSSGTPYRNTTSVPYLSLRELNMERQQRIPTYSSFSGPVYLVT